MDAKWKALLISMTVLALQAGVAGAIYSLEGGRGLGKVAIITILAGGVIAYAMLDTLETQGYVVVTWVVFAIALGALFFLKEDIRVEPAPLLLGGTVFSLLIVAFCSAYDLKTEGGKRESLLLIFAILAVPQLCVSAVAARLLS